MEVPAPDAKKLLQSWMEWERGEVTPGRVMANLKTGGLPVLLESLVSADETAPSRGAGAQRLRSAAKGRPAGKGHARPAP